MLLKNLVGQVDHGARQNEVKYSRLVLFRRLDNLGCTSQNEFYLHSNSHNIDITKALKERL